MKTLAINQTSAARQLNPRRYARLGHLYCAAGIAVVRGRYHQVLRPLRYLAKFANRFCRHANILVRLDLHRIWLSAPGAG